jgi:phosphatidylserine decarboxylase
VVTTSFAPGAFWLAGLLVLAALPATVALPPVGLALLALAGAVVYVYRDPERTPPPGGLVAPADGTVSVLRWDDDTGRVRVGIYLSLSNVHVVRTPAGGRVHDVRRESGPRWPATLARAEKNERVHVDFDGLRLTMLTGAAARRIRPYVDAGDRVRRGARLGHIAFGSRVDVLLPPSVGPGDVAVDPGECVRAGESVLVPHGAFSDDRANDAGPVASVTTATR